MRTWGIRLLISMIWTLYSVPSLSALMPITQVYTERAHAQVVYSINIIEWIEQKEALVSARGTFDMNKYISLKRVRKDMTQEELGKNVLLTTLRNLDNESVQAIKETMKSVEKVTTASYVSEDKSELKMKMDLIRSEAKIEYHGSVDAALVYQMDNEEMRLEVSKDVDGTRLLAEHITTSEETRNLLGVRWNF